jgi:hypothetical protein
MGNVFNMNGGGGGIRLSSISITTPPTKTAYKAGESFSTAGMVVTATYSNGATVQATGYAYDTSALAAGTTSITITYSEGGVKATATQAITVTKTALTVPTQSGSLTYSGSAQSPTWANYDSGKMTLGGTTSGTNAGSYSATFTIKDTALYEWTDGTTAAKSVTWKIGQATPTFSLSATSVTLNSSTTSTTVTANTNSDGAVSASSSDTSVATASVSGKTVTIKSVNDTTGSATVTVSVAASTNYLAASGTVSVSAEFIPAALNDNTWAQIGEVSVAGEGDLYWDVGDAKQGVFNGKVGDYLTLSNANQCVYILDFNHADGGVADKNIMWGTFLSALTDGVPTAMCDSKYSSYLTDGTKMFNMNHWGNYNYGGWAGCDLRYDILGATNTAPSGYGSAVTTSRVGYDADGTEFTSPKTGTLLAAFPSDLRAVMRFREHYADSKGNSSNVAANVTKIKDAISLVMEFELFGARSYANQYEQNQQTQFTYFKNANSKKFMKHDAVSTEASYVWLGSAICSNAYYFCISGGGSPYFYNARGSFAVVAAFKT